MEFRSKSWEWVDLTIVLQYLPKVPCRNSVGTTVLMRVLSYHRGTRRFAPSKALVWVEIRQFKILKCNQFLISMASLYINNECVHFHSPHLFVCLLESSWVVTLTSFIWSDDTTFSCQIFEYNCLGVDPSSPLRREATVVFNSSLTVRAVTRSLHVSHSWPQLCWTSSGLLSSLPPALFFVINMVDCKLQSVLWQVLYYSDELYKSHRGFECLRLKLSWSVPSVLRYIS